MKAVRFLLLIQDEQAQEASSKYALVVSLVAIAAVVALRLLGGKVNNSLNNSGNAMGD